MIPAITPVTIPKNGRMIAPVPSFPAGVIARRTSVKTVVMTKLTNGVAIHVNTNAMRGERTRVPNHAAITHGATMKSGKPTRKPFVYPFAL